MPIICLFPSTFRRYVRLFLCQPLDFASLQSISMYKTPGTRSSGSADITGAVSSLETGQFGGCPHVARRSHIWPHLRIFLHWKRTFNISPVFYHALALYLCLTVLKATLLQQAFRARFKPVCLRESSSAETRLIETKGTWQGRRRHDSRANECCLEGHCPRLLTPEADSKL